MGEESRRNLRRLVTGSRVAIAVAFNVIAALVVVISHEGRPWSVTVILVGVLLLGAVAAVALSRFLHSERDGSLPETPITASDLDEDFTPPRDDPSFWHGPLRRWFMEFKADGRAVRVLFATTRAREERDALSFNGERAALSYGVADITVPPIHRIGRIERPMAVRMFGYSFELPTDQQRHFNVAAMGALTPAQWRAVADQQTWASRSAMLYVHGYNTDFSTALFQTAQMSWDLNTQIMPVLFSWPSRASATSYIYDRESALASEDAFLQVLANLRRVKGLTSIHILAHSMGNQLVVGALKRASARSSALGEYVMAAPDVDRDVFVASLPAVRQGVDGITLYASSEDKALAASKSIAGNVPRVGEVVSGTPAILEGVDSIDVSALGSDFLGHSEVSRQRSILNDVAIIFRNGTRPPHDRLAEIRPMPDRSHPRYWRYAD